MSRITVLIQPEVSCPTRNLMSDVPDMCSLRWHYDWCSERSGNGMQTTIRTKYRPHTLHNRIANFTHAKMTHWRWVCHIWKYNTINYTIRITVNGSRPQRCIALISDWWNTSENKTDIRKYNSKYLTGLENNNSVFNYVKNNGHKNRED